MPLRIKLSMPSRSPGGAQPQLPLATVLLQGPRSTKLTKTVLSLLGLVSPFIHVGFICVATGY